MSSLEAMMNKLKTKYGVSRHRVPLTIPYRETIRGKSDVQGRHKKQSVARASSAMSSFALNPSRRLRIRRRGVWRLCAEELLPAVEKDLEELAAKDRFAGHLVRPEL